jgi:hypothetical protein
MQSNTTRIYETDDYLTIGDKVYNSFEVNQSCTVKGFILDGEDVIPKGKLVLQHIERLDVAEHYNKQGRRKRVKPANSIGDYVAGKIFCYEERIKDKKIIFLIWRKQ